MRSTSRLWPVGILLCLAAGLMLGQLCTERQPALPGDPGSGGTDGDGQGPIAPGDSGTGSEDEGTNGSGSTPDGGICPQISGVGTNPGEGVGAVTAVIRLADTGGSVSFHPVLPNISGVTMRVYPDSEQVLSFSTCPEQVSLGRVVFEPSTGGTKEVGEISFQRGSDFACGQSITISFSWPCQVTLEAQ